MTNKKLILLLLHLVSMVLLGLGLYKDMLQIDISAHFIIDIKLFKENRSILGVLRSLWQSGNYFPWSLIMVFGIIVPLAKSIITFYLLFAKNPENYFYQFIQAISKWAMADVFTISIFVAFLGANAMENTGALIQEGYYYFAAYVLLSGAITHLILKMKKSHPQSI